MMAISFYLSCINKSASHPDSIISNVSFATDDVLQILTSLDQSKAKGIDNIRVKTRSKVLTGMTH